MQTFIIQSHRGAGTLAPENTIAAFELAWQLGVVPEADVRTTQDGVIVAFHDRNFSRVVRDAAPELKAKSVEEITFVELSALDVGAEHEDGKRHHAPALSEVFASMQGHPERGLYLDVKHISLESLAALVRAYNVASQVTLASTDYDIIRQWKAIVPASQTLLWMGGTEAQLEQRLQGLREVGFADITQLQIHTHILPRAAGAAISFNPTEEFLRGLGIELRQHGVLFQSLPWNNTETDVYTKLLDLGVQSFATDHPLVTLQAVRMYRE